MKDDFEQELLELAGSSTKRKNNHTLSSDEDSDDEYNEIKEWGDDLIKDEADRAYLNSLTEMEREEILADRAEKRQIVLERLQVKRKLKQTSSVPVKKTPRSTRKTEKQKKRYLSSDDEKEEKKEEVITLEEMIKLQITRETLVKWVHAPYFDVILNTFARIYVGKDSSGNAAYRVTQIQEIKTGNKTYTLESTKTNKVLRLKHGKAEKDFQMDGISNSPITQSEYLRYLTVCKSENVKLPTQSFIASKSSELENARNYVLTSTDIESMISSKQALLSQPVNVAAHKIQLMTKRDVLLSQGDELGAQEIQYQIDTLEVEMNKNDKLEAFKKVNERNRNLNEVEARQARVKGKEKDYESVLDDLFDFSVYQTPADVFDSIDINKIIV